MPQLHLYLPEDIADEVKRQASEKQVSVSSFLADIVKQHVSPGWPEGFFEEVYGCWEGPLERPPQGEWEERDSFD